MNSIIVLKILFLSQIDESVLNNEAFLNCDASFDLVLNLGEFINSCADANGTEDAKQETSVPKTFKGGLAQMAVSNKDIKHCTEGNLFFI